MKHNAPTPTPEKVSNKQNRGIHPELKVSVYVTRVHKHFLKQPPSKSTVSGGPSNIEKFWNAEIPEMVL